MTQSVNWHRPELVIPIEQLSAFADGPFNGNPAAVCLLDQWLPEALMQAIAAENNLSETAFVVSEADRHALRWFTPRCEVEFCGHATLAAAAVLFRQAPTMATLTFATRSGALQVERNGALLTLKGPALIAAACPTPAALVEALGVEPLQCLRSTDWLVVFDRQSTIEALAPAMDQLASLEGRGVIVTAPGDDVDFVSRFFAPGIGIAEDPVTGSAHCILMPYWAKRLGRSALQARQLSQRGGLLHCRLEDNQVLISGRVVPYLRGNLVLPNPI